MSAEKHPLRAAINGQLLVRAEVSIARDWGGKSVNWLWLEQFARLLVQFLLSLALARMLTPADFGLAASVAIVVGLATALADPGVSSVVVQWKEPTPSLEAAASWSALVAGVLAALLVLAIAPKVSSFLGASELASALQLTAISVALVSLTSVRSGLLMRMQRFRAQASIAIAATIGSAVGGVIAAATGYGVLSLFLMPIIGASITMVAQVILLGRVQHMRTDRSSVALVLASVKYLVGVRIADAMQSGIANAAIAKSASFHDLGMFNRAEGVKQMPITLASAVIGRLYFPRFAAAAHLGNDRRAASMELISAIRNVMLPSLPALVFVFQFSHEIVVLLYGQKWVDASRILEMLLLGAAFYLLHLLYVNFLLGLGGSRSYFWLDLVKKMLLIAAIILIPFGSVILYALGLSVCWIIICALYFYQCRKAGLIMSDKWPGVTIRYGVAAALLLLSLKLIVMLCAVLGNASLQYIGSLVVLLLTPAVYLLLGLISVSEFNKVLGVHRLKSAAAFLLER